MKEINLKLILKRVRSTIKKILNTQKCDLNYTCKIFDAHLFGFSFSTVIFIFKYLEKRERFKMDFLKETVLSLIKWARNIKAIEVLLSIERVFFFYFFFCWRLVVVCFLCSITWQTQTETGIFLLWNFLTIKNCGANYTEIHHLMGLLFVCSTKMSLCSKIGTNFSV